MSGSKRKSYKRDLKARLYLGSFLLVFALGVFVYMLLNITTGITASFIISGVVMVVFLFAGIYVLSPVFDQMQKNRQAKIAKGG